MRCCNPGCKGALVAGILHILAAVALAINQSIGFFHCLGLRGDASFALEKWEESLDWIIILTNDVMLLIGLYVNVKSLIMTWLVIEMLCSLVCINRLLGVYVYVYGVILNVLGDSPKKHLVTLLYCGNVR